MYPLLKEPFNQKLDRKIDFPFSGLKNTKNFKN